MVNRSPTRGQWGPVAAQPPSAVAPLAHSKLTQYVCAGFLQLQNNLSQTWWLQVTASYCPSALEARSPPSRYLQAHMSPEASRGAFIPCLSHFFFFLQDHVYFILFSLKKKKRNFLLGNNYRVIGSCDTCMGKGGVLATRTLPGFAGKSWCSLAS